MAEKVLQKLEDQLNCSICLDTYTNPKLLQCFHVYCKECLVRLVDRDQQGQLSLTCPNCRQVTPIPDTGVSGLQSAFHINHLLEIVEEHKKGKDTAIAENTEGVTTGAAVQQQSSHCTEHVDEELKLYCETCSEVICYKCVIKGGQHHSHDYESIGEAFEKFKEEASAFLEPMGNQFTRIDQALTDLEACSTEVAVQREFIEVNIEDAVRELYIVLEARKTELLNRLQEISQGKLKSLATQKNQLETTQAQLHSCEGFVRHSIKTECQSEVLKMRKTIVHHAKELTTEFPPAFLNPCAKPDMMFSSPGDVTTLLQQYGNVSTATCVVNPVKCHATGKGLEAAVFGEKSTATVRAVSWNGCPCLEPIESLECELESMLTGARVRGGVKESGKGQYEISYQPVTKGRNQLHVRVGGLNIRGSPFNVAVSPLVEHLGVPAHTFGTISRPWGATLNRAGELIVSFPDSHQVSVFDPKGTKLRTFGTRGFGKGQMNSPMGVTFDDQDNILVADTDNHRIQKFTSDGRFLASVGSWGENKLQFGSPMGIVFSAHNKEVYVVDNENHHIQVLNSNLTFSRIIGGRGTRAGQFSYPWDVACDISGNLYVIDSGNNRVQVFTASGTFLREFGHHGQEGGSLNWPVGIAVDESNKVFVTENNSHRISVFTTKGQFVASIGRQGERAGELQSPKGLAMDKYGVLYVCDYENHRIQMF